MKTKILSILALLLMAVTQGAWAQTYNVTKDATMSEGWAITPDNPVTSGATVTAAYSGTRHVKSVKYVGIPVLTAPTAKNPTYSGSAQALVNAGSTTGGTLKYKLGAEGEYSTTVPTATNAGSYTVYYKVDGGGDFKDIAEASVGVTINKAAGAATLSTTSVSYDTATGNRTVTVSGNTGTVSASVTSGSGCSVGVSGTTITITRSTNNAFSATITVTIAASTNYNSTTKTISVSGSKTHAAGDVESAQMGYNECAKVYTSATSGYYIMCNNYSTHIDFMSAHDTSITAGGKTFTAGTKAEWEAIMTACGGTGHNNINTKCRSVSGWSEMNGTYWTKTAVSNSPTAWYFNATLWETNDQGGSRKVRLIAAF